MSDKNRPRNDDGSTSEEHDGWSMRTKLILGGIGVIGFIILYLLAVYWIPGEWMRFITGITKRSTSTSWLLGLAIGFTFSLLPILVFLMGMRMRRSWRGIIGWLLVALIVALPNILTLGVRFGTRAASKAARTTMFSDAPGFTVASYVGMAVGIATGLWVAWITISRRQAKRKAEQLAAKTREHEQASAAETSGDLHDASADVHDSGDDRGSGDASLSDSGDGSHAETSSDDGAGFSDGDDHGDHSGDFSSGHSGDGGDSDATDNDHDNDHGDDQ